MAHYLIEYFLLYWYELYFIIKMNTKKRRSLGLSELKEKSIEEFIPRTILLRVVFHINSLNPGSIDDESSNYIRIVDCTILTDGDAIASRD